MWGQPRKDTGLFPVIPVRTTWDCNVLSIGEPEGKRCPEPIHSLRSVPDRPFPPVARVSLIRLCVHDTAHTPDVAGMDLTIVVDEASAEVDEPGVGGIFGVRCRRPITGRLNVVKGMA